MQSENTVLFLNESIPMYSAWHLVQSRADEGRKHTETGVFLRKVCV